MDMLPSVFLELSRLFEDNGFHLYLVGGSVRDLLLGLEVRDLDFATDATPAQMKDFLPEGNYHFERFGVVSIKRDGCSMDIVTFRLEKGYRDARHPDKVVFVTDMYLDSCRRDFPINAMYMDAKGNVIDYHEGVKDLSLKRIRFIGNPYKRIEEDPLRILRAYRFANRLGFDIEPSNKQALEELAPLLEKLNPEKVNMERKKE